MRFVIAGNEGIDPSGYLAQLPQLAAALPWGARAFAEGQGHYDLNGPRCVKDRAVLLDEVLPHAHGCSHEIGFRAGSLAVIAKDLTASWTASDCPERAAALAQA